MNDSAITSHSESLFDWSDPLLQRVLIHADSPWEMVDRLEGALLCWAEVPSALNQLQERYPSVWFDPQGLYWIDPSTKIEPGAYLSGRIMTAAGSSIGHCARLRGPIYLGPGSCVGHGSEIKRSILMAEAKAAHLNFVGDSVLGERVNLGAGAVLANLRFDGRPVVGHTPAGRHATAHRKCGSILGADSQVGCSATLGPGTMVGRGAWINPNLYVRSWVPAGFHLTTAETVRGLV